MWRKLLIGLFLTFSVVIVRGASDPAGPGIPALQSNSEYVALRDQDSRLQVRIDEMQTRIAGLRAMLRENPAAQETYGAQILALESEMLSAQGLRTQVAARINAIEQAWLTEHPDYVPAAETEKSLITQTPESQQSRNLVFNGYFRENLPARDYEALLRAQRMEAEAADSFEAAVRYRSYGAGGCRSFRSLPHGSQPGPGFAGFADGRMGICV